MLEANGALGLDMFCNVLYRYGPVPLLAEIVKVAKVGTAQVCGVVKAKLGITIVGSVITMLGVVVNVHPQISVTVTLYVPAPSPLKNGFVIGFVGEFVN